jgi:predicted transcriptional regulator of viral defense system
MVAQPTSSRWFRATPARKNSPTTASSSSLTDHEDLTVVWLWSEQAGVFSHQTALALHDLSDVLPSHVHLTLPEAWQKRRLRVPDGVVLHYGDVAEGERRWFGPVPATAPLRTLEDCAAEHLPPELLRGAALDALHRGLVSRDELAVVEAALEPFGGLEP